jgi:hypothetical protein
MNLEEAREIIKQPIDGRTFRFIMAASEICSPKNSGFVSINELLECLRLGNQAKRFTLIAEYAAIALYTRTGRQREEDCLAITDVDDWVSYLISHDKSDVIH